MFHSDGDGNGNFTKTVGLRWCYTRQFATTIFSAAQLCSIVATLFRIVTTLFQHCNAVLRWKSSLLSVLCNITFSEQNNNSPRASITLFVNFLSPSWATLTWIDQILGIFWERDRQGRYEKPYGTVWTASGQSRWHASNIVSERLVERAWWTESKASLMNIYFRLSGFQSSLQITYFRYGLDTCF